jgi:hypothetical protein
VRSRLLEDGDELALPWDDLADGRAWPLVRGRDFFVSPREVEDAARNAAGRLGKEVQTVRALRASVLWLWVQFADYRIEPGAPCPCGSDDLRRVNDEWAICASCESTLLVDTKQKGSGGSGAALAVDGGRAGDDSGNGARLRIFVPEGARVGDERKRLAALRGARGNGAPRAKPSAEERQAQAREREETRARNRETRRTARRQRLEARNRFRDQQRPRPRLKRRARGATPPAGPQQDVRETLDGFTDVRLWTREDRRPGWYWGCGYDHKGRLVLLEVAVQLTPDGAPVPDPAKTGRSLHSVSAVPTAPFSSAVDAEALLARPDGMSADDVLGLGPR